MGVCIDLTGKVAIITGGARGIGAACCRRFAEAGAKVVLNHRGSERSRRGVARIIEEVYRSGKGEIVAEEADVTDYEEVRAMYDRVLDRFGSVDIVVSNAGICSVVPFEKLEPEVWERTLRVNLTGAFNVIRHAIPVMLKQGRGNIIIIGSSASYTGGGGGAHYSASKTGLEGLTRDLTREFLKRGIRANTIQPAAIDTEMFRERYPDSKDREKAIMGHPLGRLGTPEDIANVALFLASDLSEYICGQHILVDGGRTFFR